MDIMCCMQSGDKEQSVIKSRVYVDIMCCMQSGDKEQSVCGHNVLYAESG